MKIIIWAITILMIIPLSGCDFKKITDYISGESQESKADKEIDDNEQIRKVVEQWNITLNNRDEEGSEALFADRVFFYTKEMSGREASKERIDKATSDPTWTQQIISDIKITEKDNGVMTTSFTKQSHSSKGVHTYPGYLELEKINGEWKIVKESDKLTDKNVANRKSKIPKDAIRGDFDGDGNIDYLWISAKYDADGYVIGETKLKSNNPNLEGMTWNSTRGAILVNLGDLNDSGRDFLGCIPLCDSNWINYYVYGMKNGHWKEAISPFTIWLGDDDVHRVSKGDRAGYVTIKTHDMDHVDIENSDPFEPEYRSVKLRW